jgi:cholesterol transport system auxiliary component
MTLTLVKNNVSESQWPVAYRVFRILTTILLLAGCTGLPAPQTTSLTIYILEAQRAAKPAQIKRNLVLAISEPEARPGFDTTQITYVQQPHELNYFATSQWADTPAHMLGPLLVQTMEQTGSFRAVVQPPDAIPADVRLETELVRLWQNFSTQPSQVQLTLRAQLIDVRGQRVLAIKQFDETEAATSENAYGGVMATNRALQRMLGQVADFCVSESVIK